MMLYFTLVCLYLMVVRCCHGDGTISVKLERYENKHGTGHNGHCCDGKWGICQQNGCDHAFTICLDNIGGEDNVNYCPYGKRETDSIKDSNINVFGDNIRGTPNPMVFPFRGEIPTSMALKVNVKDSDAMSQDDHVDFLRKDILSTHRLDSNIILSSRTWLEADIWSNCSTGYYNRQCQTYCPPPGREDHYICDVITGARICQQGWIGEKCDVAPCDNYPCENEGQCDVTAHGRPLCVCAQDYTGEHCEMHKCEIICQPGTCIITNKPTPKFICHCDDGNGTVIIGSEKACEFPTTTPSYTTVTAASTPKPLWNNDCSTIVQDAVHGPASRGRSGTYQIHPPGGDEFDVYCHMTSSAEGWTVIQRRLDGSEDFFRGWDDYRLGFGKIEDNGEYWLGLEYIHRLTSSKRYHLRVDIVDYYGDLKYADYSEFQVESEENDYRLHVGGYSGDAGDSLSWTHEDNTTVRFHDGMPFSTYDHDLDMNSKHNCAKIFQSGWWFSSCFRSNLNGVYRQPTGDARCCVYKDRCVMWQTIDRLSLARVEMKIIPNNK